MTSSELPKAQSALDSPGESSFAEGSMFEGSRSDGPLADIPPSYTGEPAEQPQSMWDGVNQFVVNSIVQYPAVCVGLAVATGMVLGCLVKRR